MIAFFSPPPFPVRPVGVRPAQPAIAAALAVLGEKDEIGQLVQIAPAMMDGDDDRVVEVPLRQRLA
jgi:hypothetical protein